MKKRITALLALAAVLVYCMSAVYAEEGIVVSNEAEAERDEAVFDTEIFENTGITAALDAETMSEENDTDDNTALLLAETEDYEPYLVPNSWVLNYVHADKIDKEQNYVQATKKAAIDGENSLELCYPLGDLGDATALMLRNYSVAGAPAGKYKVSFAVKGDKYLPLKFHLEQDGADYSLELKWKSPRIKTADLGDGWWNYSITVTAEKPITQFYFEQFDQISEPVYIDNVIITKDGETENLVENGSFEDVTIPDKTLLYEPYNVIVSERGKEYLTPSWTNPPTEAEEIRLYDITAGKAVLLSKDFDKSAGAINYYRIEKLEPEKEYRFRLEFDFGENGVTEFYTSGVTNSYNAYYTGGWACEYNYGNEHKFHPIAVGVDTNIKHDGVSSLNIKSNAGTVPNLFLELNIAFNDVFQKNKNYRVSYWVKTEGAQAGAISMRMEGSAIGSLGISGDRDWTQVSYTYNTEGDKSISGCLKFWILNAAKNIWIDDIEIYETAQDGTVISDNLFTDAELAGFEKGVDLTVPPTVKNVSAEPLSREAKLSWENPSSSVCNGINLYQVVNDKLILRGVLPTTQNEITISHLENEKEYTYVLKTVSKYGVESEAAEISVMPVTPDVEILPLDLNGGADNLSLGANSFSVKVMNNLSAERFDAELIVALFKNDGKEMVELKSDAASLEMGTDKTLSASVTVPNDGGDYIARVFIWNRLFGLDALREAADFTLN